MNVGENNDPRRLPRIRIGRKHNKALASETHNWYSLPMEVYPKYEHLCTKITEGFTRPVFSKGNAPCPRTLFMTNQHGKIDFRLNLFPSVRLTHISRRAY